MKRKVLTSWYGVPVGSVDDVVGSEKVLVVARPPVWVGHRLVEPRRAGVKRLLQLVGKFPATPTGSGSP